MVKSVETLPLISVICCAHNEEEYVDRCLQNLSSALDGLSSEAIFVADRCTDGTAERAKRYDVKIIEKKWKRWRNSYSESLQTGYLHAKGIYISIIDADVVVIGTPIDLGRVVKINTPSVRVRYELQEIGKPTLEDVFIKLTGAKLSESETE